MKEYTLYGVTVQYEGGKVLGVWRPQTTGPPMYIRVYADALVRLAGTKKKGDFLSYIENLQTMITKPAAPVMETLPLGIEMPDLQEATQRSTELTNTKKFTTAVLNALGGD
jgi:hypothetical protein